MAKRSGQNESQRPNPGRMWTAAEWTAQDGQRSVDIFSLVQTMSTLQLSTFVQDLGVATRFIQKAPNLTI